MTDHATLLRISQPAPVDPSLYDATRWARVEEPAEIYPATPSREFAGAEA